MKPDQSNPSEPFPRERLPVLRPKSETQDSGWRPMRAGLSERMDIDRRPAQRL